MPIDENEPSFKKGESRDFHKKVRIDKLDLKEVSDILGHPNFPTYLQKAKALIKDHHANNPHGLDNTPFEQINSMGMELGVPSGSGGTIKYILELYEDEE